MLLIVLLAVIPAFALNAYTAISERRQAAAAAEKDAMHLVQLVAREQRRLIESTRQLLLSLSKLPEVRRPSTVSACHRALAEVHRPFSYYRLIGVALPDGRVYCRSLPIYTKVSIHDRGYFQRAMESRDFGIGDYQIGRATLKNSVNFGQAVLDAQGNVLTVVYIALDLSWLNQLIAETDMPPSSTLTVVDNQGTVMARYPDVGDLIGKPLPNTALMKAMLSAQNAGTIEVQEPDRGAQLYVFAPLHDSPSGNAYVTVGISKQVAYAIANKEFTRNLLLLLVVAVLVLITAWVGSDAFVRGRLRVEATLRESEERFRSLTQLSSDFYWETDAQHRFLLRAAGDNTPAIFPPGVQIGKTRWELPHTAPDEEGWRAHRATLDAHRPFRDFRFARLAPDGSEHHFSVTGEPVFDRAGNFTGYRGVGSDITERKRAEERIQYLAMHDGLTSLPNRAMFSEMLNLAIHTARRYENSFAVLFIDLDRFKIINDTLGHEAGDALLQEMSRRVKETLRSSDVVARLGGDEFVVLLQEVNDREQIAKVARKLLSTLIKPVVLVGQECRVTASIGVSMYPADAEDEQTLMKNADMAMYVAKEEGRNNFQFYSKDIKTLSLQRLTLETSLRRALEREELFLHYQAKRDLKTGAITGVEALVRWQHPDLGPVSPAQFVPLAEETGLIVPLGRWVLKTACAQNVAWQRAGLPPVCMAVNLSARQFADESLLQDLAAVLRETGMAPELLELEITESMVMGNVDRAASQLAAMKQMGVRIAIDDFGTGYSSLAQIKRFPIDTLKVDRSFIREIPQNAGDKAITEAIIAMGRTLSLTVVAEGVETQEQETFLREHACNEMQGFYFSKPVAAEQFAELLRKHMK